MSLKGIVIATMVAATLLVSACNQKPPEPGSAYMEKPMKPNKKSKSKPKYVPNSSKSTY